MHHNGNPQRPESQLWDSARSGGDTDLDDTHTSLNQISRDPCPSDLPTLLTQPTWLQSLATWLLGYSRDKFNKTNKKIKQFLQKEKKKYAILKKTPAICKNWWKTVQKAGVIQIKPKMIV